MKFFVAAVALFAAASGVNACGADCQTGVASGMANYLFSQFADDLADCYTKIQTALASTAAAAPAVAAIKTALTGVCNTVQPKFFPIVHDAVFKKYHGVCTDVGLLCGNPVAVYYGAPDALTVAQNAAQTLVTPLSGTLAATINTAVTGANLDAATLATVTAAVKSNVPSNITLKYDPNWIPVLQASIVNWP